MANLSPDIIARILCTLLNRSYNELNGEFYISLTHDREHVIIVKETSDHIIVENFIPGVSKGYLDYLSRILADYPEVRSGFSDGKPVLIVDKNADSERIRGALIRIYESFAYDRPSDALKLFGGFIIHSFGQKFSVVLSRDRAVGLFSENYVSLPDETGWFFSHLGIDNIYLPILSWKHDGSILAYVPSPDGSLKVFNVSEFFRKLQELFIKAGISMRIEDETELFQQLHEIEGNIELIETALKGKTIPFMSQVVKLDPKLRGLLEEVKGGLEQIKKMITLSKLIEQRVIMRKAIKLARMILGGEKGVISIATRKVSKLGAGYAVYISKEEAKALRLADKVTVKIVIEEGQKPKIVIQ